jgi:anti-anti-sigma factor
MSPLLCCPQSCQCASLAAESRTPFGVAVTLGDDALLLTPSGDADVFTASTLRLALARAADSRHRHVVVDLDHLAFFDASLLGLLVMARRRIADGGGSLRVRCERDWGRRLFTATGLAQLLEPVGTTRSLRPTG